MTKYSHLGPEEREDLAERLDKLVDCISEGLDVFHGLVRDGFAGAHWVMLCERGKVEQIAEEAQWTRGDVKPRKDKR